MKSNKNRTQGSAEHMKHWSRGTDLRRHDGNLVCRDTGPFLFLNMEWSEENALNLVENYKLYKFVGKNLQVYCQLLKKNNVIAI